MAPHVTSRPTTRAPGQLRGFAEAYPGLLGSVEAQDVDPGVGAGGALPPQIR